MDVNPDDYLADKERFGRALELDGDERRRYLDGAFEGDPAGRARIERLLAAEEAEGGFLDTEDGAGPGGLGGAPLAVPEVIGPYRVRGVLGSGGMGIVYRAEQQSPRREVALKVLRSALAGPDAVRRFEREAEVLGRLSHPGIARVHEAGTAEVGGVVQPYFAMELVEGESLVEHAQRRRLPLDRRIELMAEVCDAVEHAHQRAVVHRDLKPGNVLVDGEGQVKVLDFGIARVLDRDGEAGTLMTASGMLIGTLAYMSPEQARGERELDSRADVYSLGVMAYELFSGRLPHDLAHRSFHAAVETIESAEPQRLGAIDPALRGDLEVVVGHALEKEPGRRYPSAAAFSDDLRRVLRQEAVVARPASSFYQLRKFARRNRVLVAGVASTIVALAVGLAVSVDQFQRAKAARAVAEEETVLAQREARKALSINDFVLEDMLAAPDPWQEAGDIRVSEVLDRAAARVEGRFEGEPAIEASVRATLGGSYMARGLYEEAEVQLERALALRRALHPDDHPDLAASLSALGTLKGYRGALEESEALAREAVALCERLHGDADGATGDALLALGRALVARGEYDDARGVLERCLAIREELHPGAHPDVLAVLGDLGALEHYAQDFEAAARIQERALAMAREVHGATSPFVGVAENDLAQNEMAVLPAERRGEAIDRMRRGVGILEASLGPRHAVTVRTRRNLGIALGQVGEDDDAERILREAWAVSLEQLGRTHTDSIQSGNAVAHFLMARQRNDEALAILDQVVPAAVEALGPEHPDTIVTMFNRAWLVRRQGRLEEALGLFRDVHQRFVAADGPDARRTLMVHKDLLTLLIQMGQVGDAGEVLLAIQRHAGVLAGAGFERIAIDVAQAANQLGGAVAAAGDHGAAATYLGIGHGMCVGLWSADDWRAADTASKLGETLAAAGRAEEAERHLRQAYGALRADGTKDQLAAAARERLAAFLEGRGDADGAAALRAEGPAAAPGGD